MISFQITIPNDRAIQKARKLPAANLQATAKAMDKENQLTLAHIIRDYASFPKDGKPSPIGLRVQSGLYRRSLRASDAIVVGQQVLSSIGSNVKYAAAHEFGATIPAQTIYPKKGKALRFMIGSRMVFAKKVNLPERVIPARAPIQHGIRDRLANYSQSIGDAIAKGFSA